MFRKRKKQTFPEGTFLPTKQRVMAILQLCLALCSLLFAASWPFLGQYFEVKSQMLLFEHVTGEKEGELKELFENMPREEQLVINANYSSVKRVASLSFLEKLHDMFSILFLKLPLYNQAWILFGILIPIFLLKKREGAKEASLILPLIAAVYLIHHTLHLNEKAETSLFPQEKLLENRYIEKPLKSLSIKEQKEALLRAWHFYVIEEFLNETPSADRKIFQSQVKKGEHAFYSLRAAKMKAPLLAHKQFEKKEPLSLLLLYLAWNCFFAFTMQSQREELKTPSYQAE